MKKKTLVSLALLASAASLSAAVYDWNTGNGVWGLNEIATNWLDGSIPATWSNSNSAVFGGGVGHTVTTGGVVEPTDWWVKGDGSWNFVIPSTSSLTIGAGSLTLGSSVETYAFVKEGTGQVSINGTATIGGRIAITAGILEISSLGAIGNAGGEILLTDAALRYLGAGTTQETLGRALRVERAYTDPVLELGSGKQLVINQLNSNSNTALRKTGSGALVLSGTATNLRAGLIVDDGSVILAKSGTTYCNAIQEGGLTINAGTVTLAGNSVADDSVFSTRFPSVSLGDQISRAAVVQMNGGLFDLAGKSESIGSLFGDAGRITNSTSVLAVIAIGETGKNASFGGEILDGSASAIVGLLKRGQGTLILTGSNSYTGQTIISNGESTGATSYGASGVLQLGTGGTSGALGQTDIVIDAGTILRVNRSNKISLLGQISGTGAVEKLGAGELTFSAHGSTFAGLINVLGGSVRIADQSHLSGNAKLRLVPGTEFFYDSSAVGTLLNDFDIPASGSVALGIRSNGTLTLGGTLTGLADSVLSKGANGALVITGTAANTVGLHVRGGEVSLEKTDVNAVGAAGLTIDLGQVSLNGSGEDQIADTASVRLNGGTLELNGHSEVIGSLAGVAGAVISNASASTSTLTLQSVGSGANIYAGDITGKIDLVVNGTPGSLFVLAEDTTYQGETTVQNGTLQVGIGGASGSLGAASNTGEVQLSAVDATLAFNRSDDTIFDRNISGVGNLEKHGAGELTINGAAGYMGVTTITGGKLIFANGVPTTSALNLSGGGVLDLSGGTLVLSSMQTSVAGRLANVAQGVDIIGSITLSGGHTLGISSDATLGSLTISDALTLSSGQISFTVLPTGNDTISTEELVLAGLPGAIRLEPKFPEGLLAGAYELIKIRGGTSLSSSAASYFSTSLVDRGNAPRGDNQITYSISIDTTSNTVVYNVAGGGVPLRLSWQGSQNAIWSEGAGPPPINSADWMTLGNTPAAEIFFEEDFVFFGDNGRENVSIQGTVRPSKVVVDATQNYSFIGGVISDSTNGAEKTGLVKTGSGVLAISGDGAFTGHTFTGPVEIKQGVLELKASDAVLANIGAPSALGAGDPANNAGSLILDGGILRIEHTGGTAGTHSVIGVQTNRSFTLGPGNGRIEIVASYNDALVRFSGTIPVAFSGSGGRTLILAGDAGSLNTNGLDDFYLNPATGGRQILQGGTLDLRLLDNGVSPLKVIKTDTGTWVLQNSGNDFSGGLEIRGGGVLAFSQGALGKVPEVVTPRSIILGSAILYNAQYVAGAWAAAPVVIEATRGIYLENEDNIIWASDDPNPATHSFTINSAIDGSRSARLIKVGAGTLALNKANTFLGGLYIQEGEVIVGTGAAIPYESSAEGVYLGASGTLEANGESLRINKFLSFSLSSSITRTSAGKIINSRLGSTSMLTIGETGRNNLSGGTRVVDRFIFEGSLEETTGANNSVLSLVKTGQGIATLALKPTSNYSGGVTVLGGILRMGSEYALGQATNVVVNGNLADGGTLDLAGRNAVKIDSSSNPVDVPIHIAGVGSNTSNITPDTSQALYDRDQVNGLLGALSNTHPTDVSTVSELILTNSATVSTLAGINLTHVRGNGSLTLARLTTESSTLVERGYTLVPPNSTTIASILLPSGSLNLQARLAVTGGDLTIDARDGVQVGSTGEIILTAVGSGTTNVIKKSSAINLTGRLVLVDNTVQVFENLRGAGQISHNRATNDADRGTLIFDITSGSAGYAEFAGKIGHMVESVQIDGATVEQKVENSGNIDLVKRGGGVFILSGRSSDYLGITRIEGGVLELRAPLTVAANVGSSQVVSGVLGLAPNVAKNLVIAGGILRDTSDGLSYTDRLFTIGVGGATIESSGTSAGLQFRNTGNIVVDSLVGNTPVTLTLGGTNSSNLTDSSNRFVPSIKDGTFAVVNFRKADTGSWTLAGTNNYTGWTHIEAGALILGAQGALPVRTPLTLGTASTAGTLRLNGYNATVVTLEAASTTVNNRVINGANIAPGTSLPVLTVNSISGASTYTGTLGTSGAGNTAPNTFRFVKNGPATLTLAGPLAYTGDTEVLAGTLKISGEARSFASSYIFVSPDNQATLDSSSFVTQRSSGLYVNSNQTLVAGGDGAYQNLLGDYRLNGGTIHIGGTRSEKTETNDDGEIVARQTVVNDRAGVLLVNGNFYSEEGTVSSIVYTFAPTITSAAPGAETDLLRVGFFELAGEVKIFPYIEPSEYAGYRLATTTPGDASAGIYPIINYGWMLADIDSVSQLTYGLEDPRYRVTFEDDPYGKTIYMRVTATSQSPAIYWEGVPNTVWGDPEREGRNFKQDGVAGYVSFTPGAHAYFTDRVNESASRIVRVSAQGIEFGAATFDNSEGHDYTLDASGGSIRGTGYLEKIGSGALTINNSNAYTGGTILGGGTLIIGNDQALGTGTLFLQGGTFASSGARTLANAVDVQGSTSVDTGGGDLVLSGILKGAGTLTKKGLGVLTLTGNGTQLSGGLTLQRGIVAIGESTQLSNAALTLSSDSILTASFSGAGEVVIGSLSGNGIVKSTTSGQKNFRIGARETLEAILFSGSIQDGEFGSVSLTKEGTSTLVLSGVQHTYTGATVVKKGTLQVGNGESVGSIGTGNILIESAGTLRFDGGRVTEIMLDRAITSAGSIEKQGENILTFPRNNPTLGGTILIAAGEVWVGTKATGGSATGDLGHASVVNNATLIFNRVGDYSVGNNLSGFGDLLKLGLGTLYYTGDSTATGVTRVSSGAISLGDGTGTRPQLFQSSEVILSNSRLILNPGPESTLTLGAAVTGSGGIVDKEGTGTAILTGRNTFLGALNVKSGILQIGDGGNNGTLESSAPVNVASIATLRFNRSGSTEVAGRISSRGEIQINGGTDGTGTIIFMANNDIAGDVYVNHHTTLQLGNGGRTGSLGSSELGTTVHLAPGTTFAFNRDGLETKTGTAVTIEGAGNFVKLGKGTTFFNSTGNHTGGTIVEDGRLIIPIANLPRAFLNPAYDIEQTAYLAANGEGVLELRNDTTSFSLEGRVRGTGTIALGAEDAVAQGAFALYRYSPIENGEKLRALDVLSRVNLNLGNDPSVRVNVGVLNVQQGGILTGQGTIDGTLNINIGGEVRAGISQGRINVRENIVSSGKIAITLDRDASGTLVYDTLHYEGSAEFKSGATFDFDFSRLGNDLPKKGTEIYFLVDENAADNPLGASVVGNFSVNAALRGEAITYNNGKGLTLLFASSIHDVQGIKEGLHNGLGGYMGYLDGILMGIGREEAFATLDSLLKADRPIGKNLTDASPLGLASLSAMSVTGAQHAAGSVRSHLESMRYERAINGAQIDFSPYISGVGIFAKNNTSVSAPVFDINSYGGLVGVDTSLGEHLLGFSASYNTATATMHGNTGKTNADTARLTLYGTFTASQWVSLDAQLFAGYSSYNVKHDTIFGRATAKPKGYDLGASAYVTGIIPLPGEMAKFVHFTPYAGLEFVSASVDSFTETSSEQSTSALAVDSFTQNSLRAKIGTSLNWVIPTNAGIAWRLGLEAAYAHELLDAKVDLKARFANDTSREKFKAVAAATAEQSLLIGPSVELTIGEYQSVQFGYTLEYSFGDQTIHHINASYRIRF
ncbi:MAG: autotransporter-associated beta strand repeat-containing protein [Puniceicoccales bacterium]|nr:autotransporter-associated beta strand repeat-containing protein [Puniceicoccales bacterium]